MSADDTECISRWLSAADRGELSEGEACIVAEVRRLRAENERLRVACVRVLDYYDHGQLSDHRAVLRQVHDSLAATASPKTVPGGD